MRLKTLLVILGILLLGSGVFLAKNTIFKPEPPKPMQSVGFENVSKDFPSGSEKTNEKNSNSTKGLCAQIGKDSLTYEEAFCEDTVGETKGVQTGNSAYNFDYGSDSKDYTSTNPFSFSDLSNPSFPYNSNPPLNTQGTNYLSLLKSVISSGNQIASSFNSINSAGEQFEENVQREQSKVGSSAGARGLRGGLVESQVRGVYVQLYPSYRNTAYNYLSNAKQHLLTAEYYLKNARPYPQSWNSSFNQLESGLTYLSEAITKAQVALDNEKPTYLSTSGWQSSSNAALSSVP